MRVKSVVASVVGQTDKDHWGQVLVSPTAYGVVEVETKDGQARHVGVEVLSKLANLFDLPPSEHEGLSVIADTVMAYGEIVSLVLLVPHGSRLLLCARGSASVYLKRHTELAKLLGAGGELTGEIFAGDTILCASRGFTKVLTEGDITSSFDHLPASGVAEKLTLLLHEKTEGIGGAALIFQAENAKPEDAELPEHDQSLPAAVLPIGSLLSGFARRIASRVQSIRLVALKRKATAWFERVRSSPKRASMVLASALLIVFGISIVLGIRRELTRRKNQTVVTAMAEAERAFEEGVALFELNAVKGREKLEEAKAILEPVVALLPERSDEGRRVRVLYQKISENTTLAMKRYTVVPSLFYDVTLLKKGGRVSSMSLFGDNLGILDQTTRTVYSVVLTTKQGSIAGGGDIMRGAARLAASEDGFYLLADDGIYQLSEGSQAPKTPVIKTAPEWGTVESVAFFAGNVYLLDSAKGRIWKYVATEKGFSDLREYLNPDTLPDLKGAVDMAIDGAVWVSTNDGKLLRFSQGKESPIAIRGVEPPFFGPLSVFVSDENKYVYLLDRANKRVVVLDKEGLYLAQYAWEGDFNPTGMVVSESRKVILLINDGLLYSIELK